MQGMRAVSCHCYVGRTLCTTSRPPSRWEQLKTLWREHGMVFIGTYTVAYTACFGAAWGAIAVAQ